jgi:hypothetical protein
VAGLAILIGSLALSPPRAVRRADGDCGLSGVITMQGRLVARGKLSLSCVMLPDPQDVDGYSDLTVPVVDGRYAVSGRDGLRPGHYRITVAVEQLAVEQLGLRADPSGPADNRPRTAIRGGLVPIFSDCVLDIDLQE